MSLRHPAVTGVNPKSWYRLIHFVVDIFAAAFPVFLDSSLG